MLVRVALPRRMPAYQRALWALVKVDLWCLRAARLAGQPIRPIYQSVCYQRERAGQEVWRSSKALSLRGIGDCEDLACARVAERLSVGDYCRPAIRLSALMRKRVIYVMTHDSIFLGEDGPTHQTV